MLYSKVTFVLTKALYHLIVAVVLGKIDSPPLGVVKINTGVADPIVKLLSLVSNIVLFPASRTLTLA